MSDDSVNTEKRRTVTTEFMRKATKDNEKRRELEAAVELVRAMHAKGFWGLCRECHGHRYPCPTLRALEVGRE